MFRLLIVGGEIFSRVKAVCDIKVLLDFSFQSLIVLDVLQTSKTSSELCFASEN